MRLVVREMTMAESARIVDYFHDASDAHLDLLGVDRSKLPDRETWRQFYQTMFAEPVERRSSMLVSWLDGDTFIGFSTADKITRDVEAFMHLHIVDPGRRAAGIGRAAVRRSAALYFDALRLERLYCEPHAFNVAPNRTLQSAGFTYVKTHMTTPGPLNSYQAVNRWVIAKSSAPDAPG